MYSYFYLYYFPPFLHLSFVLFSIILCLLFKVQFFGYCLSYFSASNLFFYFFHIFSVINSYFFYFLFIYFLFIYFQYIIFIFFIFYIPKTNLYSNVYAIIIKKISQKLIFFIFMVSLGGVEPPTYPLGEGYSIHLSYKDIIYFDTLY